MEAAHRFEESAAAESAGLANRLNGVAAERDELRGVVQAARAKLAEPDKWRPYESHDLGEAFLADVVLDWRDDVLAVLAAAADAPQPEPANPEDALGLNDAAKQIIDELRDLWQRALEREGNLASAVADTVWKATQYGETADGDTAAYLVPKGTMHRLVGVAQSNGAHVPVSFRAAGAVAPSPADPAASNHTRPTRQADRRRAELERFARLGQPGPSPAVLPETPECEHGQTEGHWTPLRGAVSVHKTRQECWCPGPAGQAAES